MGEPPRLTQILLPQETAIIYFVTLCVNERRHVLAEAEVFEAIRETIQNLRHWRVLAGVIMPDHAHFVVTPLADRSLSAADFSNGFKRVLRKRLGMQSWEWQRGCFDRLLRSDENLHNKWIYVEQNPVRARLVQTIDERPYYLGSIAEQRRWQPPLQKKAENGKLAPSPTEGRA
jgi:putative transposase